MADRRSLTRGQRLDCLHAHHGLCYLCGEPINLARARNGEADGFEVEHPHALGLGGADDPSNWRPAHIACHAKKTRQDRAAMAKCKRIAAKHQGVNPDKPKRKIASRGFDTRLTRGVSGAVTDTETGRVIRPGMKGRGFR